MPVLAPALCGEEYTAAGMAFEDTGARDQDAFAFFQDPYGSRCQSKCQYFPVKRPHINLNGDFCCYIRGQQVPLVICPWSGQPASVYSAQIEKKTEKWRIEGACGGQLAVETHDLDLDLLSEPVKAK